MNKITMKAAVCREFGADLQIENVVLDPPETGEVRVKVSACAICHSDIHAMDGAWGGSLPTIHGHEAAGTVEAVGSGIDDIKIGDFAIVTLIRSCETCAMCKRGQRHLCTVSLPIEQRTVLHSTTGEAVNQGVYVGAFAEYVLVDQSQITVVQKDLPATSAALLSCGVITGLGAVSNTANIPAGADVGVIGCGGVGLNSIQGAVLSKAKSIVAIDIADDKIAVARKFGATAGFNSMAVDTAAEVASLTGNVGLDYVFVTVGNVKAIELAQSCLCRGGTIVVVGMPASGVMYPIELTNLAFDEHRIIGSRMGSTDPKRDLPKFVSLYLNGSLLLDELVTDTYTLDDINDAIQSVRDGHALRNVVVFPR
jgi:Zn-dependent alcohol dehydrogenase